MVEADPVLVPRNNDAVLNINPQTLNPNAHLLQRPLIFERHCDMLSFFINLSCKSWQVFALIIEIEDEDTVDARRYQAATPIIEVGEVDEPNGGHINLMDLMEELI